jgi:signal transduction histidine kinase
MSPQQLQNLFRIDLHPSSRGTAGEQGNGLGLIVCNELVEKHGSTLHVESQEGKGSRFWFEL